MNRQAQGLCFHFGLACKLPYHSQTTPSTHPGRTPFSLSSATQSALQDPGAMTLSFLRYSYPWVACTQGRDPRIT